MYINKIAYCEALYVFTTLWAYGQGSEIYANHSKLNRWGFRPSSSVSNCKLDDPAARSYYRSLCIKHGV